MKVCNVRQRKLKLSSPPENLPNAVVAPFAAEAALLSALSPMIAGAAGVHPLEQMVAHLPTVLPCDKAAVWVAAGTGDTLLRCVHAVCRKDDGVLPDTPLVDRLIEAGPWQAHIGAANNPLLLSSPDAITDWRDCFGGELLAPETKSLLLVPLAAGDTVLGLLIMGANTLNAFEAAHVTLAALLAPVAALAAQNIRLYEVHCIAAERQAMLDQISEALQKTLDLETLIGRIFDEVNKALHAEAQSIWLVSDEAQTITCRFATGPGAALVKEVAVPLGEGIVGKTVAHQKSYLITDAQKDVRHSRRADNKTGIITRSLLSVPMVREGKAIGAIQAINKQPGFACSVEETKIASAVSGEFFTPDDMELFRAIADIAALAIENARLYADLQASYDTTLDALTAALDCRDKETEGHCRRVSEYSVRLAQQVGMNADEVRILRRGALIHDIGKIGVPDAVLQKNGPLTRSEWEIMQKHPQAGWEMLQNIPYLQQEVQLVLTHQERWDGNGYPFGLRGENIPFNARIFAIADTFDAILSDRPYRRGRPYEEAAQIIAGEAGRQFDPRLVTAFLEVPPADWEKLRHFVMSVAAPPPLPTLCS